MICGDHVRKADQARRLCNCKGTLHPLHESCWTQYKIVCDTYECFGCGSLVASTQDPDVRQTSLRVAFLMIASYFFSCFMILICVQREELEWSREVAILSHIAICTGLSAVAITIGYKHA